MAVKTLQSWKEIARYVRRGVRTVQRWEEMYALPVHRPAGHGRAAVYALEHEVDAWLASAGTRIAAEEQHGVNANAEALFNRLQMLEAECARLRQQLALITQTNGDPRIPVVSQNGNGGSFSLLRPAKGIESA